jgi:hypothetical protein
MKLLLYENMNLKIQRWTTKKYRIYSGSPIQLTGICGTENREPGKVIKSNNYYHKIFLKYEYRHPCGKRSLTRLRQCGKYTQCCCHTQRGMKLCSLQENGWSCRKSC